MPLKSEPFQVQILGKHSILLPQKHISSFLDQGHSRVKVKAKNGAKEIVIYAAILKRKDAHYIMFGKRNQEKISLSKDNLFTIQLFEDTSKYGVEVPEEMEAVLLTDYEAYQIFESLTAGFKRSLIYAISRYKNSQTRIDKSLILCENLKRGIQDRGSMFKE
tara:strand:+ start:699 stop:1184 length:486 start_codon:yes stop_codon:yes gene_type:complete